MPLPFPPGEAGFSVFFVAFVFFSFAVVFFVERALVVAPGVFDAVLDFFSCFSKADVLSGRSAVDLATESAVS